MSPCDLSRANRLQAPAGLRRSPRHGPGSAARTTTRSARRRSAWRGPGPRRGPSVFGPYPGRRLRCRGRPGRTGLRARLRRRSIGRYAPLPFAGRRPRDLAKRLPGDRRPQPRHVADHSRRGGRLRHHAGAEVPACLLGRGHGQVPLADRPRAGTRRDRAAVVCRAMSLHRYADRSADRGPRRHGPGDGHRLPYGQGPLAKPQPAEVGDDPRLDRAHGVRRPADVRLLRQGRRGRHRGRQRRVALGQRRMANRHGHLPLARRGRRGADLLLRRLQLGQPDAATRSRSRAASCRRRHSALLPAVRFRAADAGLLAAASLRRAAERPATGLHGSRRQGTLEQRAGEVRIGPLHDCRWTDLRAG